MAAAAENFFYYYRVTTVLLLCYYSCIGRVLTGLDQTPPVHPVPGRDHTQ